MTQKEEWESLAYKLSEDGLDYAVLVYSNWEEIKDKDFHELRKRYEDAAEQLENYINNKLDDLGIDGF